MNIVYTSNGHTYDLYALGIQYSYCTVYTERIYSPSAQPVQYSDLSSVGNHVGTIVACANIHCLAPWLAPTFYTLHYSCTLVRLHSGLATAGLCLNTVSTLEYIHVRPSREGVHYHISYMDIRESDDVGFAHGTSGRSSHVRWEGERVIEINLMNCTRLVVLPPQIGQLRALTKLLDLFST